MYKEVNRASYIEFVPSTQLWQVKPEASRGKDSAWMPTVAKCVLLWRWCWQMLAPPALFALAPDALVLADARPPALLAFAPDALVMP